MLVEITLMIFFSLIKLRCGHNFGNHLAFKLM